MYFISKRYFKEEIFFLNSKISIHQFLGQKYSIDIDTVYDFEEVKKNLYKNLIFITDNIFNNRDYERYGISFLVKNLMSKFY